jgi:ADP-heptose:LPS heptosyltransferase
VRAERPLVIDLLGGLGDLVMALPVVHALAARHAPVTVLTHAPGHVLLRHDPAVARVLVAERGAERAAVEAALDGPDLVVTTTRYDGIGDLVAARAPRSVADLWRSPPPDEPVGERYLRILAAEGLVDDVPVAPRVHLTATERAAGRARLASVLPDGAPVVLVPAAGMAVKVWPHWRALAAALAGRPVAAVAEPVGDVPLLPPVDLRGLAALFAAVADRHGVVVGPDTGPMRVAAAVGARTVGLFGPTLAARYGLGGTDLQGLPGCPHRRPTAITEQVCWWEAACPLSATGPACLAELGVAQVLAALAEVRPSTAVAEPR